MKITLIADVYGQKNNGTTIAAKRLVENLKKRGHDVKIVSADENSDYVLKKRNFFIFNNYLEKQNGVALAKPDEQKMREAISQSDVVHLLLPFKCSKRAIKICQELKIPYTSAAHWQPENISSHIGLKNWTYLNDKIYAHFLKKFYKDVHFIHCPSQFSADELNKHHYKAQKYVISNGVADHIKPIKTSKPKKFEDKFVVLSVGRFSTEKRQDLLINAVKQSKYSDKIQLILSGSGPRKKYLQKLSKDLKNKPIIDFLSKQDLTDALNYADLYVHTSEIELEGISCLEAISCGQVPIISNGKRAATKQFALTEKNLFEVNNPQDLANKIDYFIEHPQEIKELKQKYIEYSKQFKIENSIIQMEQMFKDAIEFYKEYYALIPQKPIKPKIDYPEDEPQKHITKVKRNKKHHPIDEKYVYNKKNFLYQIGALILRFLAWILLPFWIKPFTHYKIIGKENLKEVTKTGVIITSNHVHFTDAPLIATRLFGLKRKVRIIMLSANMDIPVAGPFIEALGCVPLGDTIGGMKNFNNHINKLLQSKKPVLIFPETALWPYYRKIRPFSRGPFMFSVNNNVPILPVVITFRTRKNRKQKMIVNILKPVYPKNKNSKELLEEVQSIYQNFVADFYKKYN